MPRPKLRLVFLALVTVLLVVGCRRRSSDHVLQVGASAVPHAEILRELQPVLAAEGIELRVTEMSDYVQPNTAVVEGELDANFFQHEAYLADFNQSHGTHLQAVARVHVEPLGLYSRKLRAVAALPEGATIALPNDPTNVSRALRLLAKAGLLEVPAGTGTLDVRAVSSNPKRLVLRELEASQLARVLDDVDAAVINTNYALAASLDPTRDALTRESEDSPYANVLVVDPKNAETPRILALVRALHRPETRELLKERYHGALFPAF